MPLSITVDSYLQKRRSLVLKTIDFAFPSEALKILNILNVLLFTGRPRSFDL